MRHLLLILLLCLAGCSQEGWNDRLASAQEQARALRIADQVRAGRLDKISEEATSELRPQLPSYMTQIATLMRSVRGAFHLQTVSSFSLSGGSTTKTFVVQAGSADHWAVVQIVFQGSGNAQQLAGLNVTSFKADRSKINNFEIGRRGLLGYLWLTMMLACACTCVWAVILIWRSQWQKRRWLWTLGSLFGFAGFGLNWSTGAWAILFINVSLLGAQGTKAGPYAPWLLSFGFPVVALIVIVRWYRRPQQGDEQTLAAEA